MVNTAFRLCRCKVGIFSILPPPICYIMLNRQGLSYEQKVLFEMQHRLIQIDTYFPIVTELLPIAEQCREVRLTEKLTRRIASL